MAADDVGQGRRATLVAHLDHLEPGKIAEAFRLRGLALPKVRVTTYSVDLRMDLLQSGSGITVFPSSILRLNADRFPLRVLPVDLPTQPWPVAVITLKRRTLSPVVQLFIEELRAFARENSLGMDRQGSA